MLEQEFNSHDIADCVIMKCLLFWPIIFWKVRRSDKKLIFFSLGFFLDMFLDTKYTCFKSALSICVNKTFKINVQFQATEPTGLCVLTKADVTE